MIYLVFLYNIARWILMKYLSIFVITALIYILFSGVKRAPTDLNFEIDNQNITPVLKLNFWEWLLIVNYLGKSTFLSSLTSSYYITATSHEPHSGANHWQLSCLLNSLLWVITMKTSKLSATSSLWGESTMTGRFPPKRTINAEIVFMSWIRHVSGDVLCLLGIRLIWYWHRLWLTNYYLTTGRPRAHSLYCHLVVIVQPHYLRFRFPDKKAIWTGGQSHYADRAAVRDWPMGQRYSTCKISNFMILIYLSRDRAELNHGYSDCHFDNNDSQMYF